MTKIMKKKPTPDRPKKRRSYLKQSDVPQFTLEQALKVPIAIFDNFAGGPVSPIQLAKALDLGPTGSQLRLITAAANAFGLVEGAAQAKSISVTELARRIVRPKSEGDDLNAKREAVLKPRVFDQFLKKYDGSPFPRGDIATNVIEQEMGVPRDVAASVLERIESTAQSVGFIEIIKEKKYVTLRAPLTRLEPPKQMPNQGLAIESANTEDDFIENGQDDHSNSGRADPPTRQDDVRKRKVFIAHGKNRDLVGTIRKLLEFGELEAIVSVDRQSVSKPLPEKVMGEMRTAGAAIIHIDLEATIIDKDGNEHTQLNPNVLIEIGAAMAIYGKRFVLLVKEGVKLPSNLQGLFEVRYNGEVLDAGGTIKLLEAIKDIKNHDLPTG